VGSGFGPRRGRRRSTGEVEAALQRGGRSEGKVLRHGSLLGSVLMKPRNVRRVAPRVKTRLHRMCGDTMVSPPIEARPMSTTSSKLPDELKARAAALAERTGKTPHAFMVEVLRKGVEQAEAREAFVQAGLRALADAEAGARVYDGDAVHEWLRARLRGERSTRPEPLPSAAARARKRR
jgi:predicted transcriptional regulator